jgi:hypothetical protein
MEYPITTTIPHGITPEDSVGPWTPATVTVTYKDFSTAALNVTGVEGPKRVVLDFTGPERPEDVISVDVREACPSASGSASASASSSSA